MVFHRAGQTERLQLDVNFVSPEYFSLISIPIVAGRTFTRDDSNGGPRAVIVTEATARRYWPGTDPIGERFVMGGFRTPEVPLEVVGVAKDAQVTGVSEIASNYVYLPAGPDPRRGLTLLLRNEGAFQPLAASGRAVTRELDPGLVVRVNPLEDNLDFWRALARLVAGLAGSLSVLALVLASIGVYGVVSYVVSRRLREVGIRIVLGATARDVQRMILRQTLRPVVIGAVVGIAMAAAVSRLLTSVLFGVSAFDPIAFAGAALFLTGVAAAASLPPTRRAARLDPMTTLRFE
jgi:hypothetical protein